MGLRENETALVALSESLLGGEYQIQSHVVSDDCLDVYVVTDPEGWRFEAQAFPPATEMPRENEGLYRARRRRMRRIHRSPNFAGEFEQDGRRFLVSRVQRSEKEWMDLRAQVGGRAKSKHMPSATDDMTDNVRDREEGIKAIEPRRSEHTLTSYAEAAAMGRAFSTAIGPPLERRLLRLGLGDLKRS